MKLSILLVVCSLFAPRYPDQQFALSFHVGDVAHRLRRHVRTRTIPAKNFMSRHPTFVLWAGGVDFDFSSTRQWENYYSEQEKTTAPSASTNDDGDAESSTPISSDEWHSSVPIATLVNLIPATETRTLLMIGCGTSLLPDWIHEAYPDMELTLFDSSPTCIRRLEERYASDESIYSRMQFVCGDATQLSQYFGAENDVNEVEEKEDPSENNSLVKGDCAVTSASFDCIYDKGLLDALLCGEGWNGVVPRLLEESAKILRVDGTYILVSYRLPSATREFLEQEGSQWGLEWEFDLDPTAFLHPPKKNQRRGGDHITDKSNTAVAFGTKTSRRVQLSRAVKRRYQL